MKYKGFKDDPFWGFMTEHVSLNPNMSHVEAILPDGRYILIQFDKKHKVTEHIEWSL